MLKIKAGRHPGHPDRPRRRSLVAKPGEDYVTFIGSDFVQQGMKAAEWLTKATKRQRQDHRARRHHRRRPCDLRKKGFDDYIAGTFKGTPTADGPQSGMQIIASQTGNFTRDKGRKT